MMGKGAASRAGAPPFGLMLEEWDAVLDAVADHRYNLLLGAGASVGALGGDGKPLPLAERLRIELCEEFRLPTDELQSLADAYEEALQIDRGAPVEAYLLRRFTHCEPSWQDVICQMPWRRIWNLNIDDVYERAARKCLRPSQSLFPVDWTSVYRELDDPDGQVQLAYLHGRAADLGTSKTRLVFSIAEYADATATPHTWHRLFSDLFQQQPFIVVGSRLKDEVDLAAAVRLGNHSFSMTKTPSLFVSPTISALDAGRLRRWGLTPITTTAEQFFRTLAKAVAPRIEFLRQRSTDMRRYRLFIDNFARLYNEASETYLRRADFWSGVEPEWNDVLDEKLVSLHQYNNLAKLIEHAVSSTDPVAIIWLKGTPAEGKTAAMLWGARELQRHGLETWLFRGRSRLDVDALISQARPGKKVAYLFDHAGEHLYNLATLCTSVQSLAPNGPRVVLVLAERTRRIDSLSSMLPNAPSESIKIEPITKGDVRRLVSRLKPEGRLGTLTGTGERDQFYFFLTKNHGSLFDGLMDLELGTGFRARIFSEIASVSLDDERKIVYAVSMVHCFGYSVPIAILARATGIRLKKTLQVVTAAGSAGEFLILDKVGDNLSVRTLHRRRAEIIVHEIMKQTERYELGLALATACSSYLTLATIRKRELPYFIVRNLLDRSVAEGWFPSRAHDWYGELEALYGWNSRFWEQRALLESNLGGHDRAISYARTALGRHSDIFTLNTLGTVLLNAAIDPAAFDHALNTDRYWDGIAALLESRELGRSRGLGMAHPYVTFFTKTLTFVRQRMGEGDVLRRVEVQWTDWLRQAEGSPLARNVEFKSMLGDYAQQWKHVELTRVATSSASNSQ